MDLSTKVRMWGQVCSGMEYSTLKRLFDWWNANEEDILMFSTGLEDQNGKEIFEGDIVKDRLSPKFPIFEVVYHRGSFCLYNEPSGYIPIFAHDGEILQNITVIGNICENGELLNGQQ